MMQPVTIKEAQDIFRKEFIPTLPTDISAQLNDGKWLVLCDIPHFISKERSCHFLRNNKGGIEIHIGCVN